MGPVVTHATATASALGSDMTLLKQMREHADELGVSYKIKYFTEVPNVRLLN